MNENRKYKCTYILLGIMTFICGAIWSDTILRFITRLIADRIQPILIPIILLMLILTLLFGGITYLFLRYGKRNAETEFTRMGKYYVLLGLLSWGGGIIWFLMWFVLTYFSFRFMFSSAPWYINVLCSILMILPIAIFIILLCLFRVYGIDHFKCWGWKHSLINLIAAITCTALSLFLFWSILWNI